MLRVALAAVAFVASVTTAPSSLDDETVISYLGVIESLDAGSAALAVASPRSAAWRFAEHQVALD